MEKNFVMDNIYNLAKAKNIKIGDIEEAAGVSKGYLSRLAKENNKVTPSIDLVATAAELLGVSIDYLVHFNENEFTENEKFVFQFIEKLQRESANGKLEWAVESSMSLNGEADDPKQFDYVTNPLVEVNHNYSNEFDKIYYSLDYNSRFHGDGGTEIAGDCFHTTIPKSRAVIYLMKVQFRIVKDSYSVEVEDGYEVYIFDKTVRPVCCTKYLRAEIKSAVNSLYNTITGQSSRLGFDDDTKNVMKNYLGF